MNSFWKRKRILVTGAGGFVGSHVVDRLIKTRGVSIKNIRAHGLKNGDLREFPSAQKAVEGIDCSKLQRNAETAKMRWKAFIDEQDEEEDADCEDNAVLRNKQKNLLDDDDLGLNKVSVFVAVKKSAKASASSLVNLFQQPLSLLNPPDNRKMGIIFSRNRSMPSCHFLWSRSSRATTTVTYPNPWRLV